MNGVKFLLDTCFIIRWRKLNERVFQIFAKFNIQASECAYSDISYAEVFGWNGINQAEEQYFKTLLNDIPRLSITDEILERTILLRQSHKIKLPDALILATAKIHHLQLLTLDEKLERIYQQTI